MRELVPYKTLHGAQKALDNGGRFYNLFSAAADAIIEPSELARAAGSLSRRQGFPFLRDGIIGSATRRASNNYCIFVTGLAEEV